MIPQRRGFSLIEVLLALAILVVIASLGGTAISGLVENRRLVRGGDVVRVAMVQARLEAMRSGRTQVMRFQINTPHYIVQPWYDASDVTEAGDMTGQGMAVAFGATPMMPAPGAGAAAAPAAEPSELPEKVVVADALVKTTLRSMPIDQASSGAAMPAGGAGGQWTAPVLFYPDGTTSNAAVTVGSEGVGRIVIRLRGLTGETTVSEVLP